MSSIPQPTKTLTYKTVGKLEIPLDLYLPEDKKHAPVLLWFHGGGLLQGRRDSLAPHMRKNGQQYGYACVSADYRLAPQVSVADILEDVKDCIAFIRTKLASEIGGGDLIDPTRLAVSGSSAGGYLTLLAGLYVEPKPQVILPIYPITDPLGSFFITPQPPPMGRHLARKEDMAPYLDPKAKPVANNPPLPESDRGHMYPLMMHSANLAKLWHVPEGVEGAKKWRLSRNVYERRLPPAYFLHGDADTAVGVEQADEVVGAMLGCGIQVQYERPHGKDHFLDNGPEYENAAFYNFMLKHLK
jgi:acetyl esterase/lipase